MLVPSILARVIVVPDTAVTLNFFKFNSSEVFLVKSVIVDSGIEILSPAGEAVIALFAPKL